MDIIFLLCIVTKHYGCVSSLEMFYISFLEFPAAGREVLHKNLHFLILKK